MIYLVTTLILLVLTGLNVGLALAGFGGAISLAIAAAEAVIMAVVFMRLRWSPAMTRLVGVAALLWLGILMVGTLDDILTRGWLPIPGK